MFLLLKIFKTYMHDADIANKHVFACSDSNVHLLLGAAIESEIFPLQEGVYVIEVQAAQGVNTITSFTLSEGYMDDFIGCGSLWKLVF